MCLPDRRCPGGPVSPLPCQVGSSLRLFGNDSDEYSPAKLQENGVSQLVSTERVLFKTIQYILYQKRLSFSDALELAVTSKGCKLRIVAHAKNIVAIALILHGIGLLAQALLLKAERL